MEESIYGDRREEMEQVLGVLQDEVARIRSDLQQQYGMDPVEHCLGRIKSEESMREKCRRKGFREDTHSALDLIHDGIGLRVVCAFLDDVYVIRDRLIALEEISLVEEKDYIHHAKPNGYRSLHLIIRYQDRYFAELQLRTISMDTWAALEHHIRYKKDLLANRNLIESELKRCADELAATDASMQTIRDMIREE